MENIMTNKPVFEAAEIPKSPFEAGIQLYNEPKPSNERDLVIELRGWLEDAGVPDSVLAETYDLNRHVKAAKDRIAIVQRTHLNQFIVLALYTSPLNTIQMRSELLPNGSMSLWEDFIRDKVAPFIADNKLLG